MTSAVPDYVPSQYRDLVAQTSAKYGIDPDIISAVILTESSWDINSGDNVDSYNSYGLGQLIQMNWANYPQYQPGNAAGQIDTVGQILAGNYKATGSWSSAIAAYNTGLGGYTSEAGQHYASVVWSHIASPPGGEIPSAAALSGGLDGFNSMSPDNGTTTTNPTESLMNQIQRKATPLQLGTNLLTSPAGTRTENTPLGNPNGDPQSGSRGFIEDGNAHDQQFGPSNKTGPQEA